MKPITVFTSSINVFDDDLFDAIEAFKLDPIPTIKTPAVEAVEGREADDLGPEIIAIPAQPEVPYSPEERLELARAALKQFRDDNDKKQYTDVLVDAIAKKKDAETRAALQTVANDAINSTFQTQTV